MGYHGAGWAPVECSRQVGAAVGALPQRPQHLRFQVGVLQPDMSSSNSQDKEHEKAKEKLGKLTISESGGRADGAAQERRSPPCLRGKRTGSEEG